MTQPEPVRKIAPLESLERGLMVLQVFSAEHPALTLSEVARLTGLTRATARRIILTLEQLGHVRSDGRLFSLTPKVLNLGWAYLSSLSLEDLARPILQDVVDRTGESVALGTLDLPDIAYLARSYAPRHRLVVAGGPGTRLPSYATSLGQVLLAQLSEPELEDYLATIELEAFTPHTCVSVPELRERLAATRERGYGLSDQDLELGLRGVAVPVRGYADRVVAAMSISANAALHTIESLVDECLPPLREGAAELGLALSKGVGHRGAW